MISLATRIRCCLELTWSCQLQKIPVVGACWILLLAPCSHSPHLLVFGRGEWTVQLVPAPSLSFLSLFPWPRFPKRNNWFLSVHGFWLDVVLKRDQLWWCRVPSSAKKSPLLQTPALLRVSQLSVYIILRHNTPKSPSPCAPRCGHAAVTQHVSHISQVSPPLFQLTHSLIALSTWPKQQAWVMISQG